ncbi:xanthine dehydrogenase family protein molybdopterin-binding subunit [Rhodoplanes sp. Z2-YC6860]|uniref:xanthine dehydrogenase family protein molybdopterin-binding subunit n=1 Tax=Rhodoplanes sp. Z2-YC6860 TaxID=674703 RepID=UPI00078DE072|nr:xanthine dehydrogenase family protein molybdopterin-binding subunit [Rhodoplanes sp. Z2-YC6860]AMN43963.1 carbon-monoxide dehydrogenase large subunit [Rhodoplanes sp. Z2-YC6860]
MSSRGTNDGGLIGKPLRRREDIRFVQGKGRYVDDVQLPGTAWCAFVRSPHAHARIRSVATGAASRLPGVLLVLTAADWDKAGHGELTVVHPMPFGDGRPMNCSPRPAFARDVVHHVGDIVAAVIGETRFAAEDGAEAVAIEYEPLPAVTTTREAVAPDAPLVHPEFGNNLVFEIERGSRDKAEAALAGAAKVVELSLKNSRLSANPMEPRAYLCDYDAANDRYTLYATSQQPHYLRRWLSIYTLHIPEHKIRVISPDVGGGFGVKGFFATEVSTVVWASQILRRPVKWTSTRTETFLSDAQARDHDTIARMGFADDGRIVAMQVDTLAALGGYLSNFAPSIPGNSYPQTVTGLYRTPNLHLRVRGVYTNTVPIDAYRGSGRPEATWNNERLLERGARELGIDVVEMRKRNLIGPADFPYPAPGGRVYDSGDPPALLQKLLELADYLKLRQEQAALRKQGVLMGIGLAAFIDKAGTGPSGNLAKRGGLHGGWECAVVRVHSDGKATIFSGSHSHGQGHEITFCQIAADRLGLPIDDIQLVEGDTDRIPFGNGTWGARSLSVGGTAIYRAADKVIVKATRFAAHMMECAPDDIEYRDGMFRVRGTDRQVTFAHVADVAYHGAALPADGSLDPGLEITEFYDPPDTNDPQAMHLAVVLVDPDTGTVKLRDMYAADDCGVVVNPMIVEGQVHGGLAQGIGQALREHIVYEAGSGQLLTASFMDYGMPRAHDMPSFHTTFIETPAPSNPLGVKGGSESGTIGAPAAIGNAVIDALWHLGVRDITLPITSETVWRAMREAHGRKGSSR